MNKIYRSTLPALALVGALFATSGVAWSATLTPAEQSYLDYHFAIAAEEICTDTEFSQDQMTRLEMRVDALVGEDLSAGTSLNLIQDAKEKLNDLHSGGGCTDPKIAAGRAVFDSELKSAL